MGDAPGSQEDLKNQVARGPNLVVPPGDPYAMPPKMPPKEVKQPTTMRELAERAEASPVLVQATAQALLTEIMEICVDRMNERRPGGEVSAWEAYTLGKISRCCMRYPGVLDAVRAGGR